MELPSSLGMGRAIARRGGELGCVEGWILRKSSGKLCLIKRWIRRYLFFHFLVVQVKCNETSILDFEQFDGNKTCWVNF